MTMVMTVSANAMSYNAAKSDALFLSDKMAYELNLTAAQYETVYEINLDYLMSLNGHADIFGIWWDRRNDDLRHVLNAWQYDKFLTLEHFYRPVAWKAGSWSFAVYAHYDRGRFYHPHPKGYGSYKGRHHHHPDAHGNSRTWRNTHNHPAPHDSHHDKPGHHGSDGHHDKPGHHGSEGHHSTPGHHGSHK